MSDQAAAGAAGDLERVTKPAAGRTVTYLRNNNTRKAVRVMVRSVCRNLRMNGVTTYDMFPRQELRVWEEATGGPAITRTIEGVAYRPAPGRSKDQ